MGGGRVGDGSGVCGWWLGGWWWLGGVVWWLGSGGEVGCVVGWWWGGVVWVTMR